MSIKVYGADWCGDCRRAKQVFQENNVDFEYIDLVQHPEEKQQAFKLSGRQNIPVIVYPNGAVQSEPSNEEILGQLK